MLGKLELEVWNVKTFTFATLYEAIRDWLTFTDRGSKEGLVKDRHMFTYTSQEVAHVLHEETKPDESTFSYQMKNFFVEHKVAAETSFRARFMTGGGYRLLASANFGEIVLGCI